MNDGRHGVPARLKVAAGREPGYGCRAFRKLAYDGLCWTTNQVIECAERSFGPFAHGNDDLLVGYRGHVACRIGVPLIILEFLPMIPLLMRRIILTYISQRYKPIFNFCDRLLPIALFNLTV
jgi:hypothetical protein